MFVFPQSQPQALFPPETSFFKHADHVPSVKLPHQWNQSYTGGKKGGKKGGDKGKGKGGKGKGGDKGKGKGVAKGGGKPFTGRGGKGK